MYGQVTGRQQRKCEYIELLPSVERNHDSSHTKCMHMMQHKLTSLRIIENSRPIAFVPYS